MVLRLSEPNPIDHSTATRDSFGLLSTSISIHFAVKSGKSRNTPVMLLPGRARLAATPLATGSVSKSIATIGMVRVADRAAFSISGPLAMITLTFLAMTSATRGTICPGSPSAARATISTWAGAAQPETRRPLRMASTRRAICAWEP
jgi:hypothetical protein